MNARADPRSLGELLDRLEDADREGDRVALGTMIETVGQRSFGPLLLLCGLIVVSPLSGIPGLPTVVALTVALTAGQLLLHREHLWMPKWLMRRTVPKSVFAKALKFLRPIARFVDRFLRPRLTLLTSRSGLHVIAVVCLLIAAAMPPLELVPFAATIAGVTLAGLGLSLITRDGVVAILSMLFTAAVAVAAAMGLR